MYLRVLLYIDRKHQVITITLTAIWSKGAVNGKYHINVYEIVSIFLDKCYKCTELLFLMSHGRWDHRGNCCCFYRSRYVIQVYFFLILHSHYLYRIKYMLCYTGVLFPDSSQPLPVQNKIYVILYRCTSSWFFTAITYTE